MLWIVSRVSVVTNTHITCWPLPLAHVVNDQGTLGVVLTWTRGELCRGAEVHVPLSFRRAWQWQWAHHRTY